MELTPLQADLLDCLRSAVRGNKNRRVVYGSEYLGYLPFGLYHWVDVDGQDISLSLPGEWQRRDLEALVRAGLLAKIEEWKNPNDELETKTIYEVSSAEGLAADDRPRE